MRLRRIPALIAVVVMVLAAFAGPLALAAEDDAATGDSTIELPPEEEMTHPDDDAWWYMDEYNIGFDPTDPELVFREIIFPVVGMVGYSPGFGNCRDACSRPHNGIDIMTYGWKGLPVVAVTDGVVTYVGTDGELAGCSVRIKDADGWTSHYMHLNNDRPGTDKEEDLCFAPGIKVGTRVTAGTLIGWVGDSGNAETTPPHLHFEIRNPDGIPIDSWVSLDPAPRIEYALINRQDLYDLSDDLYAGDADTVYLVEDSGFPGAATTAATSYGSPIISIDPFDAQPAIKKVRDIDPARVFIYSELREPHYLDDIELTVPVVEVATYSLPEPEEPVEEDAAEGATATEDTTRKRPVYIHEPVDPWLFTVVADDNEAKLDAMVEEMDGLLAFKAPGSIPDDLGYVTGDRPSKEANRDGFWWPSADGWLLSEEIPDVPDLRVAVVSDLEDEATLAFLRSIAKAPLMPLWHYQPSTRTFRAL
ncbi:MAG: M23 family metallopeptidase [Acidimicrobiia bacterium]